MNSNNIEIPFLVLASIFSIEFFESWLGIGFTAFIIIFTLIRIIQSLRSWNFGVQKRNEERRIAELAEDKRQEERRIAELAEEKRKEERRIAELAEDKRQEERRIAELAEEKRKDEHEKHLLEMEILRKQLNDNDNTKGN